MRRGYKQMLKEAVEKLKDRLLAGSTHEGDVWQQLEKELQAPLPAAIAPPAQVQDKEVEAEDSDDDWGIKWKGPTNQGPERQQESVLDEIARMAATSSNWHKEDWTKKEERQEARDEEEDEFYEEGDRWRETFQTTEDKKADDEDWKPDDSWCEWISNSKEALAVENVVRKIRARAGPKSARSNIEIFPNDSMLQAMKTWLKRTIPEQRMLLAMLLFLEAQALDKEMVESPPQQVKLSEYDADQKAWGFACCRALDPHAPPCAETDRDAVDASREPTVAEELVAASTGLVWRPREEFETPESFIAHASKCLASQWLKWLQDGTLRSSADASSVDAELRKVLLPDLSSIGMNLLTKQDSLEHLSNACKLAPQHVILKKADAAIPEQKLRKGHAPKAIEDLVKNLSGLLVDHDVEIEQEDLDQMVKDMFVEQPTTVQIMGLVHCCEYVTLMKRLWDTKGDLFHSLQKQVLPDRNIQVLSRMDLVYACALAQQCLDKDLKRIRDAKVACLNRLGSEWRLPTTCRLVKEHLMLLHMLPLQRQIQVLLSIERDIELKWCDLMAKALGREERSSRLREFLNFHERLRPYLNEEDKLPGKRPLEQESGKRVETLELALMRQGVTDVFKKLRQMYKWKPDISSRKAISKTNWVARLSAAVKLAKTTDTLSADKELRIFLEQESNRRCGMSVGLAHPVLQTWPQAWWHIHCSFHINY
eukprot:g30343.t1